MNSHRLTALPLQEHIIQRLGDTGLKFGDFVVVEVRTDFELLASPNARLRVPARLARKVARTSRMALLIELPEARRIHASLSEAASHHWLLPVRGTK